MIHIWVWRQVRIEFKECEGKVNFKIVQVMKLCHKLDLAILFLALVLLIGFEDPILLFYIWVLTTAIESIKEFFYNLKNILLLFLGIWLVLLWF